MVSLICSQCGAEFENKVLLGRHTHRFHPESDEDIDGAAQIELRSNLRAANVLDTAGLPNVDLIQPHTVAGTEVEKAASPLPSPQSPFCAEQDDIELVSTPMAAIEFPDQETQDTLEPSQSRVETGSVSYDVIKFFESFGDSSEELYPGLSPLNPDLSELPTPCQNVLEHCASQQLTLGEAESLYNLIKTLESQNPEDSRPVSSQFSTASSFTKYLDRARKIAVKREGWKRAVIQTGFGTNRTGVFRHIVPLMVDLIRQAGGPGGLMQFTEQRNDDGERVFSSPCNSNCMLQYSSHLDSQGIIALIDKYSDGFILSKSGTQSANNVRVRFANLKGYANEWHEVGIVPSVDTNGQPKSDSAVRYEKAMLLQRFNFLVFHDAMRASHVGHIISGRILFPRIGTGVCDQPQERAESGLKDHGSYCDCTSCLMPSMDNNTAAVAVDIISEPNSRERKRIRLDTISQNSQCSTHRNGDYESVEQYRDSRQIQLSNEPFESRKVIRTVSSQLIVAKRRHFKLSIESIDIKKVKDAKIYLNNTSAFEFPPAFAGFAGMGSAPHRLYTCIGFDKLHVIEHGILRLIPDEAYRLFESAPQHNGWSKGDVVKIANQRILDAPRSAQLPAFAPFRKKATDVLAGVSGKTRRDSSPFLWYSLMGIPRKTDPDEDVLVQLLLLVDQIQQELLGVNRNPQQANRTQQDILKLQKLCFKLGQQTAIVLDTPVNTKLHRIMRHVGDYLLDSGCIRRGSTDLNETMHKHTKNAYSSTNRHLLNIAPQLLAARAQLEADSRLAGKDVKGPEMGKVNESHILLSRYPKAQNEISDATDTATETEVDIPTQQTYGLLMEKCVQPGISPLEAEHNVCESLHPTTNLRVWEQVKSARFKAKFPWWPEEQVWQCAYAGDSVFGAKNRRDAIQYRVGDTEHFGILQAIFRHKSNKASRVGLVRRLKEIQPELGNKKVVEEFGNRRFAYSFCGADVQLDCVSSYFFLRSAMIVPDIWLVSRMFGARTRAQDIPDTVATRRALRFFELAGFKYTSFPEQEL